MKEIKIGGLFSFKSTSNEEFNGTYQILNSVHKCDFCHFKSVINGECELKHHLVINELIPECESEDRFDKKEIIFKKIKRK